MAILGKPDTGTFTFNPSAWGANTLFGHFCSTRPFRKYRGRQLLGAPDLRI